MVPRKCVDNWIFEYSKIIESRSEAPQAYNVWSAISVIGAVLKKKVWVNRGTFKVYPNQYIVLVGPPGVGKGTAIHPAHDFIREHKPPLANYISDRATAPRIIEILSKGFPGTTIQAGLPVVTADATAVLMCSELPNFLGASDWMLSFLCDVWDNKPFHYETKSSQTQIIKDMCCSLIGGCVPEFIRRLDKNTGEAVAGGFTARTIFVFATDKSKHLPWIAPFSQANFPDLVDDLDRISKLNGEYSFSKEAILLWNKMYTGIKTEDEDSVVVKSFKARQHVHVLKVAMCFSAASNDSLVIDEYCMRVAVSLVQNVLDTLDNTFRGVGESPLAEATAKVQIFLEKRGIATRAQILKHHIRSITSEDLDRVLYTLISIDFCDTVNMGGKNYFRHLTPKGQVNNGGQTP